jgi:hypothetical protein
LIDNGSREPKRTGVVKVSAHTRGIAATTSEVGETVGVWENTVGVTLTRSWVAAGTLVTKGGEAVGVSIGTQAANRKPSNRKTLTLANFIFTSQPPSPEPPNKYSVETPNTIAYG